MINCSLILKKDTYCPHMQETPLLLSHTDTAFCQSERFYVLLSLYAPLLCVFFIFLQLYIPTQKPLIILFSLPGILCLQGIFFTENHCSLVKTEFFCKLFPTSEGHHPLLCLLCSGSMFLSWLRTTEWKLCGDISVGVSEDE